MLSRKRFVHRNAGQPGGKLCPPGKLVQMLIRAHVGVLHYILSFAIVSQNSPSHAVDPLVMTAHDDFKHPGLACQHSGHNFLVTQGLLRSSHFRWADHTDPPYGWSRDSNKGYRSKSTWQRRTGICRSVTDSLLPTPFSWRQAHMNK